MKKQRLLIGLICLALPILLRTVWFYHGIYLGNPDVRIPEYDALSIPQPALSTLPAPEPASNSKKVTVLFDQAHVNKFTLAEIEPFRNYLLSQGAEILSMDYADALASLLKKSDAFVIITPTKEYSDQDIEAIEEFVLRGGRLVVVADPTRSYSEYDTEREESVILANAILQSFDLSFRNDYVYNLTHNEGNFRNVYVHPAGYSEITQGAKEMVFYSAHSLESNSGNVLVGEESTLSSLDDKGGNLPVAVLDVSGNVLALGDMTFMTNPYYQVSDNYRLVQNIVEFLISGIRKKTLSDFPNLFKQPITVRLNVGITLDQDLLLAIADLKDVYSRDDLTVTMDEQTVGASDRILIGIYPPGDDLNPFTDSFGIDFNPGKSTNTPVPMPTGTPQVTEESKKAVEKSKTLLTNSYNVPGIGLVPSQGFGFILLKQTQGGIEVAFLADSQKNAVELLNLLVKGSLQGCLTTDTIAVCEQKSISTAPFVFEPTQTPEVTESATAEPEPIATPTP
jgi:hypothetical protein